jgi:hypothetical protein
VNSEIKKPTAGLVQFQSYLESSDDRNNDADIKSFEEGVTEESNLNTNMDGVKWQDSD